MELTDLLHAGIMAELARRPFAVSDTENPTDVIPESWITEADINRATRKFLEWADENDTLLAGLMRAKEMQE